MPGVTITRLPQTVSIVSIPRARLDALSHPLLRVLLKPDPSFLSIICNRLELALYADLDAQSIRAFRAISAADHATGSATAVDPLEISEDRWSVLQIDSHSDQLDNAGARVNELSAPLAAAGISILYQSSYMSDFIFVKEQRLAEAMSLFAAAGFALYAADPNLLTALLAPPPPPPSRERSDSAPPPSIRKSKSTSSSRSRKGKANSTPVGISKNNADADPVRSVRLLAQNLACVGLAEDAADHWALKIIKLVAFQDLVPLPSPRPPKASMQEDDDDGYFSHSPTPEPDAKEVIPQAEATENDLVLPFDPREVPSRLAELPTPLASLPPTPPDTLDTGGAISEEPDGLPTEEPVIPFFSFTRTPEGSSITAGARVLATLFPPTERHMVGCAGELDAADDVQWDDGVTDVESDGEDSDIEDDEADGPLLCALQVDLRTPGLDTHGIVHRFSHALAQGGVNHMYASTLRSANLLVPAGRARRGARLLRAC